MAVRVPAVRRRNARAASIDAASAGHCGPSGAACSAAESTARWLHVPCPSGGQHDCVRVDMLARLGFVASVLSENLSTSRTCRLRNATPDRIRELIVENLTALDRVTSFLEAHRISLYRISSNLIPFASHPVNT